MDLKLKVFRVRPEDTAADPELDGALPWRWVVVDTDHEGGWWQFSRWSWPQRAVVDSGRAPDGVTALRLGLHCLVEAQKEAGAR